MRIHLLALPSHQTTEAYSLDGFNTMTRRMAKLLKMMGHTVLLYASEDNDAPCDELITCITKAEIASMMPAGAQYQHVFIDASNPLWQLASPRMVAEIGKRKQPRDYIFSIGGGSQKPVTDGHPDLLAVEYSIGYVGNYAQCRVFQSRAWQHHCYGFQRIECGRFFDTVIPGFFETEKFPENPPEDYICYVGRFIPRKGLKILTEAAKLAGVPLKLIGHGDPKHMGELLTYGEVLGGVDESTRNDVMSRAKALICPTVYVEPYGCISPEAQLCGTPVIATDFGGFTETVEHAKTGYRCNLLGEFADAIQRVGQLDRGYIRARAQRLYSMETAAVSYAEYFRRIETLWDNGWNTNPYPMEK